MIRCRYPALRVALSRGIVKEGSIGPGRQLNSFISRSDWIRDCDAFAHVLCFATAKETQWGCMHGLSSFIL